MIDENIEQAEQIVEANESADDGDTAKEERVVIFEEALEAILFAAGHPISYATLARVFEMTPGKIKDKVFEYSLKYNDPAIPRGVILLTYGDSCQLCTKQYYLNEIREALGIKRSGSLSTSSMEALAIVAYNQPVTRIFVDTLRRADSSYAMNNLLDRGLIEAQGRLDAPGRPMLYGTTSDFLRVFGLKDLSELPTTTEEMTDMFAKGKNVDEGAEEGTQMEMNIPEDLSEENPVSEGSEEKSESEYEEYSAEDVFFGDDESSENSADTPEGEFDTQESADGNEYDPDDTDSESADSDDYETVDENDESDSVTYNEDGDEWNEE